MPGISCFALWVKIHCASLLVWTHLVIFYLRLVSLFRRSKSTIDIDMPLPATASRHHFDTSTTSHFPAVPKGSRQMSKFEGVPQYMLR